MNFNRCLGCAACAGLKTAPGHRLAVWAQWAGAIAVSKYAVCRDGGDREEVCGYEERPGDRLAGRSSLMWERPALPPEIMAMPVLGCCCPGPFLDPSKAIKLPEVL